MPIYNNMPMNPWGLLLVLCSIILFIVEFLSMSTRVLISSKSNAYNIFKFEFWNIVDWANSITGIVVGICYAFNLLDNTNSRILIGA